MLLTKRNINVEESLEIIANRGYNGKSLNGGEKLYAIECAAITLLLNDMNMSKEKLLTIREIIDNNSRKKDYSAKLEIVTLFAETAKKLIWEKLPIDKFLYLFERVNPFRHGMPLAIYIGAGVKDRICGKRDEEWKAFCDYVEAYPDAKILRDMYMNTYIKGSVDMHMAFMRIQNLTNANISELIEGYWFDVKIMYANEKHISYLLQIQNYTKKTMLQIPRTPETSAIETTRGDLQVLLYFVEEKGFYAKRIRVISIDTYNVEPGESEDGIDTDLAEDLVEFEIDIESMSDAEEIWDKGLKLIDEVIAAQQITDAQKEKLNEYSCVSDDVALKNTKMVLDKFLVLSENPMLFMQVLALLEWNGDFYRYNENFYRYKSPVAIEPKEKSALTAYTDTLAEILKRLLANGISHKNLVQVYMNSFIKAGVSLNYLVGLLDSRELKELFDRYIFVGRFEEKTNDVIVDSVCESVGYVVSYIEKNYYVNPNLL